MKPTADQELSSSTNPASAPVRSPSPGRPPPVCSRPPAHRKTKAGVPLQRGHRSRVGMVARARIAVLAHQQADGMTKLMDRGRSKDILSIL